MEKKNHVTTKEVSNQETLEEKLARLDQKKVIRQESCENDEGCIMCSG